ncbi:MAG: hypothetical protein L6V93_17815 [Clostridiales bacterium]|nr:MAG: hypothetical protein L6V93_17815 [Clostridiales bacterium]
MKLMVNIFRFAQMGAPRTVSGHYGRYGCRRYEVQRLRYSKIRNTLRNTSTRILSVTAKSPTL